MKNLFTILWVVGLFLSYPAYAIQEKIEEIYTEGVGNNQFEAKIKAIDKAMHRALLMLADKLNIQDEALKKVPHAELKSVFKDVIIRDENIRAYPSGASYNAVLRFIFKQAAVNSIIEKYCSTKTKNKFFEAMVVPVFKINHLLFLGDDNKDWINNWKKQKSTLAEHKIYYPVHDKEFATKINPTTIMKLTYDDFIDVMPFKLYKKVIIPIAEYFTNKDSGSTYLKVQYIIISHDKTENYEIKYDLPSQKDLFEKLNLKIIEDFILKYGRLVPLEQPTIEAPSITAISPLDEPSPDEVKKNNYIFLIDLDYDSELAIIKSKLESIKLISNFVIDAHSSIGYKVKIETLANEYDLSEEFYFHGLSFYFNDNKEPVLISMDDE